MKVNDSFNRVCGIVAAMALLIVATYSFSACSKDDDTPPFISPYAESRTVMVYMVAENSLNVNVKADVREMLEGMNNDTLSAGDRLVIYLDDISLPRIYVVDKNTKKTDLSELEPVVQYAEDVNSASAEQLGAFVDYVKANYPADSYGLVLWSHASGWLPSNFSGDQSKEAPSRHKSFGIDNGKNSSSMNQGHQMNIEDMAIALDGEDFDFILFDACSMQNIETAYELRHASKCLIASPAELPAPGAHYKSMVRAMFKRDNTANEMLEAYLHEYKKSPYGLVISALNTAELDDYAAYMKSIVAAHRSELLSLNTSSMLNYYLYNTWGSDKPDFLDMQGIMLKVLTADEYAQWKEKTDKMITCRHADYWIHVSNGYSKIMPIDNAQCCGITMHIPFEKYDANLKAFNEQYLETSWAKAVWGE